MAAPLTFTNPQGQSLQVNSPDGSVPSEGELDQMFAQKYGNSGSSAQSQPQAQVQPQPDAMDAALQTGMSALSSIEQPNQQASPSQPNTSFSSPDFAPQVGTELTRGVLQDGESIMNIAQGVTNLASLPFSPLGVRVPQIFKQASDYLSNIEQNLPDTNLNPALKFGLNVAGGAVGGVGEYSLASKAVEGLAGISTAGRGMSAAAKIMANPAMDEGTKAAMASSLISQNEGLSNLPFAQKAVENFLTHPILKEGTKMAMIGALNDYGQTDEGKSLASGGATGFTMGAGVGALGKLFDGAVNLMKTNGVPAAKAYLQATVGNEEVIVGGKKMKIVDAVEKYPDMFKANSNPNRETSDEFQSRIKDEMQASRESSQADIEKMKEQSADGEKSRSEELDLLRQKTKDNLKAINDNYAPQIDTMQQNNQRGMFNAGQSSQQQIEDNARLRTSQTSNLVAEANRNIEEQKNNLQVGTENVLAEQKASYEALRESEGKAVQVAQKSIVDKEPVRSALPIEDIKNNVVNAISQKDELGFQPVGIRDFGHTTDEMADAAAGAELTGGKVSPQGLFSVGSNIPGVPQTDLTTYLNKAMTHLHQLAIDNNGRVPLGELNAVKKQIQAIYEKAENSNVKAQFKPIISKLYDAFNPAKYYNEERPWLKPLAEANAKFTAIANAYEGVNDLAFDSKGNPTPDRLLKSFAENSTLSRSFRKAEEFLPEHLRVSTKIDNLIRQTGNYLKDSTDTIKTTKDALDKELSDFSRKQRKGLFDLNKQYDEKLASLKTERDNAIQLKKYRDVEAINQKRLELQQWKSTQTKAIKSAQSIYEKEAREARDNADEQYSKMKAQELLQGGKVGTKSKLQYPQRYMMFHSLFDAVSNPVKAGIYAAGGGLMSPRVALNMYKMARNVKIPTGVKAPAKVLTDMLGHPKVRQQIAIHLAQRNKMHR